MSRKHKAAFVLDELRRSIPSPQTELKYTSAYELILAVILSAQCTDERVNQVTPGLFDAFPSAESLAAAEPTEVFPYIKSVSFPNTKSKHLVSMARTLVDEHGGAVPDKIEELTALAGVGRKTAQVVASVAFGVPALPVDTHVFRVANRIGLVLDASTPDNVERQLKRVIPREEWGEAHHLLILHGRYVCTARRPQCSDCPITQRCDFYRNKSKLPEPLKHLQPQYGRFYCKTCSRYFDRPGVKVDRRLVEQLACPSCSSMNVFHARNGHTTKKIFDYRI